MMMILIIIPITISPTGCHYLNRLNRNHMHTQFKTPDGKDVIVVEVPQDAYDFKTVECKVLYSGDTLLAYKTPPRWDKYQKMNWDWDTRSPKGLIIIGVHTGITEEQAKGLAVPLWDGYRNHDTVDDGTVGNYKRFVTYVATESLYSRLRSLCLDPDNKKYFLLIKK